MPRWRRMMVLVSVSLGLLLITIDMSVLYTALPALTAELDADATEKLWILNAYPLVMAGMLLGSGTLGDRVGHRRMLVTGLVLFGIASVVAAMASTPQVLIGGRVLLAVGAAAMMPATLSLIRVTFQDENERNMAIAIWGSLSVVGAATGPVLGGVLLEYFWWGSVFLINVPVVLVALVGTVLFAPSGGADSSKPWDAVASVQVMAGLVALVYAVKEFAKPTPSVVAIAAAAAISAAGFVFFVRRQRRSAYPLIDFALLRNRRVVSGVIGASVSMFAMAGIQLVVTQRLQLLLDYSPLRAGLIVATLAVGCLPTGIVAGAVLYRVGLRPLIGGGLALAAAATLSMVLVTDSPAAWLIPALLAVGAGLGFLMTASSAAVINNVPEHRAGMASSVEEVSYELGSLTGVTVLGSILAAVYTAQMNSSSVSDAVAAGSIDGALSAAQTLPAADRQGLLATATESFTAGYTVVIVAVGVVLAGSAAAVSVLLRRAHTTTENTIADSAV